MKDREREQINKGLGMGRQVLTNTQQQCCTKIVCLELIILILNPFIFFLGKIICENININYLSFPAAFQSLDALL